MDPTYHRHMSLLERLNQHCFHTTLNTHKNDFIKKFNVFKTKKTTWDFTLRMTRVEGGKKFYYSKNCSQIIEKTQTSSKDSLNTTHFFQCEVILYLKN